MPGLPLAGDGAGEGAGGRAAPGAGACPCCAGVPSVLGWLAVRRNSLCALLARRSDSTPQVRGTKRALRAGQPPCAPRLRTRLRRRPTTRTFAETLVDCDASGATVRARRGEPARAMGMTDAIATTLVESESESAAVVAAAAVIHMHRAAQPLVARLDATWVRQEVGRRGDVCGAEQRRLGLGARSAFRQSNLRHPV